MASSERCLWRCDCCNLKNHCLYDTCAACYKKREIGSEVITSEDTKATTTTKTKKRCSWIKKRDEDNNPIVQNAFLIIAKWPIRQKSKTRLSKSIGDDFALLTSYAMLIDLLNYFSNALSDVENMSKFILFAPITEEASFFGLLQSMGLDSEWGLVPMINSHELKNPDLGSKLANGVKMVREDYGINGTVTYIGSDCLQIRKSHIKSIIDGAIDKPFIIPALDGGFVLITLPPDIDPCQAFNNVEWSTENTCKSQIYAIEKNCHVKVSLYDEKMGDVDDINDWISLCKDFGLYWDSKEQKAVIVNDKPSNDMSKFFPYTKSVILYR